MRASPLARASLLVAIALAPRPAWAQSAEQVQQIQQQIDQLRRDFGDRLAALERQLATLQGGQSPAAQAPAPEPVPPPPPPPPVPDAAAPSASSLANAKVFNPDVSVIGNFLGAAGRNVVSPAPALEMEESELSLQAVVDPYARADFFLAFGQEGVEVEEGFLTFTELPGKLQMKVGKMRSAFGKVNGLHTHALPWADRPLVTGNLLGGEEGLSDAGLSLSRLLPAGPLFLEATGQVYRGEAGDGVFETHERRDLTYLGHLRAYKDLTESTNLDLGASYSRGHNGAGVVNDVDEGRFSTALYGLDATFRWRPLQRAIYNQFVGRTEVVWSRRDQFGGREDAMGYYVSGDYQFARRWFAGLRYDRSGRADAASITDNGGSAVLTYRPSEFSQVRAQYRHLRFGDGAPRANELLFQFNFSIGAHGAHPF